MAYATIRKGSSGETVKVWQRVIGVTADGQFGSGTESSTKTWQKNHGLTADGVVGPATWSAALGVTAAVAANTAIQTTNAVAQSLPGAIGAIATAATASNTTIRQGSSGQAVRDWQQIIGVAVDGQFGPATAAATKAWQTAHGLSADGVVGPATWSTARATAIAQAAVPVLQAPVVPIATGVAQAAAIPAYVSELSVAPTASLPIVTRPPVSQPTPPAPQSFVQSQSAPAQQPAPQVSLPPITGSVQIPIPGLNTMATVAAQPLATESKVQWQRIAMVGGGVAALGLLTYLLLRSKKGAGAPSASALT